MKYPYSNKREEYYYRLHLLALAQQRKNKSDKHIVKSLKNMVNSLKLFA